MTQLAVVIFIAAYAAIALEHKIKLNKSATALLAGGVLWIVVSISGVHGVEDKIGHAAGEIFGIVIFLLPAMSLVEVLVQYEFFDYVRGKLFRLKLREQQQFIIIVLITFFLSAILDNLTTTIVMIQISRKFFRNGNMIRAAAAVVIAANAGGAWSPIGDVTTIMLWFAKKFTEWQVISRGFLPSLTLCVISTTLMARHITPSDYDDGSEIVKGLERSEKVVVALVFISFLLPISMKAFHLPPYVGILIGLSVVWLYIDSIKRFVPKPSHLNISIEELIKRVDVPSLKFFVGILMAVSALHAMGVLDTLAHYVYGDRPTTTKLVVGNVGLGVLSAILDNVPLTAMAIQMLKVSDPSLWVLLALTVGTGGSLLVIGSAAGVVAMGMVKELTFGDYFRVAFWPAFAGYATCVLVWAFQYFVLGF